MWKEKTPPPQTTPTTGGLKRRPDEAIYSGNSLNIAVNSRSATNSCGYGKYSDSLKHFCLVFGGKKTF